MTSKKVTVASLNCQGLGNSSKRRDVFHFLRQKGFSICFLQDTHFTPKLENYIRAEWGFKCYFASHSSNSRGVAILLNNNFDFELKKVYKDQGGNFIMVSLKMMDKDFLLVNLYGPNQDDPEFYSELEERIFEVGFENVIIGGDWNAISNFYLDCQNYKHHNNPKATEQIEQLTDDLDLIDIWRELNPELRRFTWRRNRPFQQGRLDYFFISELLCSYVTEVDILPGYRTDHSLITLTLEEGVKSKCHLLWKFNSSLLRDDKYVSEIHEVITNVTEEYTAAPYCRKNISKIPKSELQLVVSDQTFLDTLLMKIRSKTISFAVMKKRSESAKENTLETVIQTMEEKPSLSTEEINELAGYKQDLIELREKRMKGVLLRSRARWVTDGEKITKYFCNLEKRNYVSKHMTKLVRNDGTILTDNNDIVKEVNTFYTQLYSKRDVENCEISEMTKDMPKLSEDERGSLEGKITLEEAGLALKNMSNNKSPGSDGFTAEFFKFFWSQLGVFVVRSLNEGFDKKEMSSTQKEGVIVCIPKGDKPKEYIKNWRPISLLNVVYKIGSSCIAARLKGVLSSIINEDQTGFVPNRYLGDNVRIIYDIIDYLVKTKRPGLMLCLDFEKAFDSVDNGFIMKVLQGFGCGPDFCQWIQALYKNIKSTVLVNGKLAQWFPVERGCRQGDPVSPYLFVMCVEIMALLIRQNHSIRGIKINDVETKILQYADDTELMLEGDAKSFEESMGIIEHFGKVSGLSLNSNKTMAIWLGSRRNSSVKHMPHLHMDWNPDKFKILGIWFTNDLKNCVEMNYNDKFLEIKKMYKIWLKRQITPLGRVAVLKSLILSKITHLWLLLPNPPDKLVNELQKSVFYFTWNKKQDRINRNTSVKNLTHGGIGIPDIKKQMHALKLTWIKKLIWGTHKWKQFMCHLFPKVSLLERLGSDMPDLSMLNAFWKDVFKAYRMLGSKQEIDSVREFCAEPLFCNHNVKIGGKSIFYEKWIENEVQVHNIGHLVSDDGTFLSYASFTEKFGNITDFVTYSGCISAVKMYARRTGVVIFDNSVSEFSKLVAIVRSSPRGGRHFYDSLCHNNLVPNCCKKWEDKLQREIKWSETFKKIQKVKDVKLQWFQVRIVHRILATNVMLQKMSVSGTDKCSFCAQERENIQHILWKCPYVASFWESFQNTLNEKCENISLSLTENIVLFGHDRYFKSDNLFDLLMLLAKFYIYTCRFNNVKPDIDTYLCKLKIRYEIEKWTARRDMSYNSFTVRWHTYLPLIH